MDVQSLYAVIPVAGLLVIAVSCTLFFRGNKHLSLRTKIIGISGIVPYVCLLFFVCFWFASGKVQCGPVFLCGVSSVFALLGSLSVYRNNFLSPAPVVGKHSAGGANVLLRQDLLASMTRNILLLIIASAYSYVALDILWNDNFFAVQFGFVLIGIVSLFLSFSSSCTSLVRALELLFRWVSCSLPSSESCSILWCYIRVLQSFRVISMRSAQRSP